MTTDLQARATVRAAIVQAAFTAVIAGFSGWWAYTSYTGDQERAEARERAQRQNILEQRTRERRSTQSEVISQMSRQLGLMEAQCDTGVQLRQMLDEPSPTRRAERCYDAYIGRPVASVSFEGYRVVRDETVSEKEWDATVGRTVGRAASLIARCRGDWIRLREGCG